MVDGVTRAWQVGIRLGILLAVLRIVFVLPLLHPAWQQGVVGDIVRALAIAITLGLLYFAGFETARNEGRSSLGALAGAVVGGVSELLSGLPNHYILQAAAPKGYSMPALQTVVSLVVALVVWILIGLVVGFLGGTAARPRRQANGHGKEERGGD